MRGEPGFMGTPGKVGPPGDPGFPGMKGKTGPRGELRACAELILSSREGSEGNILQESLLTAKKAWMPEAAGSSYSRELVSPLWGYLCLRQLPRLKDTAALPPWILTLTSPLCIISTGVGIGFALRSPLTHLLSPEMKNDPFHPLPPPPSLTHIQSISKP